LSRHPSCFLCWEQRAWMAGTSGHDESGRPEHALDRTIGVLPPLVADSAHH
jgi:hypothetical protein